MVGVLSSDHSSPGDARTARRDSRRAIRAGGLLHPAAAAWRRGWIDPGVDISGIGTRINDDHRPAFLVEARESAPEMQALPMLLFFSAAEIGGVSGPVTIGVIHDVTGGFAVSLWVLTGVCMLLLLGLIFGIQRPAAKKQV